MQLVKNGGFEQLGVFSTFANWEEFQDNIEFLQSFTSYEGLYSAEFRSLQTGTPTIKSGSLSQNVIVNPGYLLTLSFADHLQRVGTGFADLEVRAAVFYTNNDGSRVNLINIEIDYDDGQEGRGFIFHQATSDNPVPFNISAVTVEFSVRILDASSPSIINRTVWQLDGVSLRAV